MLSSVESMINYSTQEFWQLADITKTTEKYKIDKNLQYLAFAPLDELKKIFIQYRFFTHYYITDLAILISKLPLNNLRSILSEILAEELGDGNAQHSHPQLYDDFLLSLGVPLSALNMPNPDCIQYLERVQNSLINKSWAYGIGLRGMGGECLCQIYLATMHEYFSLNPAIISQKNIAWKFWEIHIGEEDLHHQRIVRAAIDEMIISDPVLADDLLAGYIESKAAWDNYWQQIFKAAKQELII